METSQLRRISSQIKSRAHQKIAWLHAKLSHGLPEGRTLVNGSASLSCKIAHPRYSRAFVTFAPTTVPSHSCSWCTRSPPNLQLLIEPIIGPLCFESVRRHRVSWKRADTSLNPRLYGMTVSSSWAGDLWILTNLLHCSLSGLPQLPQGSTGGNCFSVLFQKNTELFTFMQNSGMFQNDFYIKIFYFSCYIGVKPLLIYWICNEIEILSFKHLCLMVSGKKSNPLGCSLTQRSCYLFQAFLNQEFRSSKSQNRALLISAIGSSLTEKDNRLFLPCVSIHVCVSYLADLLKPRVVRSMKSKFIMKTTKRCVSYITRLTHFYFRKSTFNFSCL